jgi:hypothetical protein
MKFKTPAANSRFAKAGVWCFYESEVLNSSFVHLMKFSAGNPRLRKAAKRWWQYYQTYSLKTKQIKYRHKYDNYLQKLQPTL